MLETLIKNEEDLNMDAVYDVIDWYKKAILLTREMEASPCLYIHIHIKNVCPSYVGTW